MLYLKSFIFCGFMCFLGQLILDNTKLSPGHITSLFVSLGAFLDIFDLYDKIISFFGRGALLPITSFGHSLMQGALHFAEDYGIFGIFMGSFSLTSSGISAVLIFSFVFSLVFSAKD